MCENCDFVHLHLHTEYSLLDGFARIDKAVKYAKELGMPALGITDHGTMFGVIDFYRACKSAEITPVIGVEAYLTDNHTKKGQEAGKTYHMLLLASNMTGYRNLLKLSSIAQLDGYYYRPRVDKDLLNQYSEGIIATSGCLAAEVPRLYSEGLDKEAERMIGTYQDIFGVENFYVELQAHDIPELNQLNSWLIPTANRLNVPMVATNDVHYVRESDFDAHDTLLCIQTSSSKHQQNRMRMTDNSYFMRTQQEMWSLFGEHPDSLNNTLLIAERCQGLNLEKDQYHLPVFPVPAQFEDAATYLEYLCEQGLKWRYEDRAYHSQYIDRLRHELKVINTMGFATYFLIVWDLCQFAQAADIWWNVRGSGAGSMVAYVLGITNLDPIENGLIFERFLNPGRVSMPDFDLDFPEDRRMEMIEYCCRKYGEDKVAAIITFGTMGAKGAIKDVGRALGIELKDVDKITRVIPTNPALPPLKVLITDDTEKGGIPELAEIYRTNSTAKQIIDTAIDLEGVPRHASTHAAGIIVADKPLSDYIPLHRPTKGNVEDSPVKMVTQFPMETAESIGLLKIDFLGLSTLTILRKACDLIEKHHQIKFDMSSIPIKPNPNDPEITKKVEQTFEMIGRGETIGVFQIESSGMRQMLTGMRPKTFEHIIAAISLYRPGPMDYIPEFNDRMHEKKEVVYHHDKLKPILGNTYGICVYQEQIMQIGAELFGYSLGEADLMRRAVSKKKEKDLLQHRQIFVERGPNFGVDADAANKIFDDIEFFARYGFNKCVVGSTEIIDPQTGRLHRVEDLASGKVELAQTLSIDTDNLRIEARPITAIMNNGVKPVYRLTTQTGRQIEATDNHPFYTFGGWRLLGELQIHDLIAVPNVIPAPQSQNHTLPHSNLDDLPQIAFELNKTQLEEFLGKIGYKTQSLKIAHQLQHLLLRLGQLSRIEQNGQNYELILFTPSKADIQGDIYWDQVVSIEYIGEQTTYDLTIEETHNFIASDILVHNSHAADYAVITCQTAYLKCHYPHEYMTALMSVYYDNSTKVSVFIQDCRRMDIEVLPPDVNYSVQDFDIQMSPTSKKKAIRFGFGAIKNVGESSIIHIIEQRENEPFQDLDDFLKRCNMKDVGKRALESLIRVGALESLTRNYPEIDRARLLANLEHLMSFSINHHKNAATGQTSMFDLMSVGAGSAGSVLSVLVENPPEEWTPREQLRWERDLMGLYVSKHPLDAVISQLSSKTPIASIADIKEEYEANNQDKKGVRLLALISAVRPLTTKTGQPMAIVTVEDQHGTIEVVVFTRTWLDFKPIIEADKIMVIDGRTEARGSELQIVATRFDNNITNIHALDDGPLYQTRSSSAPDYDEETGEPLLMASSTSDESDEPPFNSPSYETLPQTIVAAVPASPPPPPVTNSMNYPSTFPTPIRQEIGYVEPVTKAQRRLVIRLHSDLDVHLTEGVLDEMKYLVQLATQHYYDCDDYLQIVYRDGDKTIKLNYKRNPILIERVDLERIRQSRIVEDVSIEED